MNIDGWTPEDYTREYLGPVTLEHALALSLNTVAAQITAEVGPSAVVAAARRLGIGSQIEPNMSIALGTSEVSLLELTGAYATFANGGNGVIPYVIQTHPRRRTATFSISASPVTPARWCSPMKSG